MIADKIKNARTILYYITIIIVGIICTYKNRYMMCFRKNMTGRSRKVFAQRM